MTLAVSDRIERQIEINAPRERVWRAITTDSEFAKWFGVRITEGRFEPGIRVKASTTHKGKDIEFYLTIESMDQPRYFSWRWIPGASQPENEPATLVEFTLEETKSGTLVKIAESGFDRLSPAYRAKAFEDNTGGWEHQAKSLANYVAQNS